MYWQPTVVLPSWHLEDIARDFSEAESATFLHAYAVAFHPFLLAASRHIPAWKAAASLEVTSAEGVYLIPPPSKEKISPDWYINNPDLLQFLIDKDRSAIYSTISSSEAVQNLVQQKLELEISPALLDAVARNEQRFCALGVTYLLTSLLSQLMYHYENIQETRFEELVVEAAVALISAPNDSEKFDSLFRESCEQLLESREKFYAVETHLVDFCLLGETLSPEDAQSLHRPGHGVTILGTAQNWQKIKAATPESANIIQQGLNSGDLELTGGELFESRTPLLSLQALNWQLRQGGEVCQQAVGHAAKAWGRSTFGLSSQVPLLLKKHGIDAAYHLAMDSGVYPEDEQSHFAWESRGGASVEAISRLPISIDNARSLLKIPERLSDAINHDHVSCLVLAHWPRVKNPWLNDLICIHERAPILGKFVRLSEFLQETDGTGHNFNYEQKNYRTATLSEFTDLNTPDPLSQFQKFWEAQSVLSRNQRLNTLLNLMGVQTESGDFVQEQAQLYKVTERMTVSQLDTLINNWTEKAHGIESQLAARIAGKGNTGSSGLLLLNPESRNCLAAVELPEGISPKLEGCVKADQHDADKSFALVDIPAHGFCVVPGSSTPTTRRKKLAVPLAGDFFLQTEHFHVQIDVETGGIQRMRAQGSNENLYSMRLIYRLDGESGTISRSVRQYGERSTEPTYSKMVAESIQTLRTGPVVGEIQVSGKLVTPEDDSLIARFEIGYRVTRGSHVVETTIRIMPEKLPSAQAERSYYAVRSAWAASGATVKGTLQQSQFVAGEGLIESTGPIQILDGEQTISLFSEQRPFHRRTGMRMLDSLLIVHGESNREFRQAIGLNAPQLLATEQLLAHPPSPLKLPHVSGERSVWLYHFNSPSVMLLESTPVDNTPNCYEFDLNETEGRHCHVRWTLFRKPAQAWEVNFRGNILQELSIEQETILFEVMPCDYVRIRVQF